MKKFIAYLFICFLFGSSLALALPGELYVGSLSDSKKAWEVSVSKAGSEDALLSQMEDVLYELTDVVRVECDMETMTLKVWIIDIRNPLEQIKNDVEKKLKEKFDLEITFRRSE
ncbi:MAG: hypothetical protein GTO08_04265 [Deltaproteobacteria bacterium]|nr:hypothetical protein [Deltaproteobacteria bacterium]